MNSVRSSFDKCITKYINKCTSLIQQLLFHIQQMVHAYFHEKVLLKGTPLIFYHENLIHKLQSKNLCNPLP